MATEQKTQPITLDVTMKRVVEELQKEGRTRVSTDKEAAGSESLAENILKSGAASVGLQVKTTVNKKSVSAKVVSE